jgi:putative phosphoesterase
MRVALISDIHANDIALKTVLRDIKQMRADQIVCLGDVATLGLKPGAVVQQLRALNCPCIFGNHDAYLLDPELIHSYTSIPVILEAIDWSRNQLSSEDLDFLRTFKANLSIPLDEQIMLQVFHGSTLSFTDGILATTCPDDLDQMLGAYQAPVMAFGHTHIQMLRQHRGRFIVNPGSVGLPFQEYMVDETPTLLDSAEYALVEAYQGVVRVTLQRVPLDQSALLNEATETDNPLREYFIGQYNHSKFK